MLTDTAAQKVLTALRPDLCDPSNKEQSSLPDTLPHDLILKICALAILMSFSLRSLGMCAASLVVYMYVGSKHISLQSST